MATVYTTRKVLPARSCGFVVNSDPSSLFFSGLPGGIPALRRRHRPARPEDPQALTTDECLLVPWQVVRRREAVVVALISRRGPPW